MPLGYHNHNKPYPSSTHLDPWLMFEVAPVASFGQLSTGCQDIIQMFDLCKYAVRSNQCVQALRVVGSVDTFHTVLQEIPDRNSALSCVEIYLKSS